MSKAIKTERFARCIQTSAGAINPSQQSTTLSKIELIDATDTNLFSLVGRTAERRLSLATLALRLCFAERGSEGLKEFDRITGRILD